MNEQQRFHTSRTIPSHLKPFIAQQDPHLYTWIDHASWRYIMRVSKSFYSEHAHKKYLDGLEETGISIEKIPLISEMDTKLNRFQWGAVPVVGFIPPAAFMEFLSLGILPIACDMRTLEHLSYTPVPDIVHEAAGHAPIVADKEYAQFLHHFGELARKVIFSDQDIDVYNAVRELSDLKEDPQATEEQINFAQKKLDQANDSIEYISEATYLSRMGWWTFEYGLVGSLEDPKIYGAGLLSSVGEGYYCLSSNVQKIPFSIDCIEFPYDITKPQPQLFVTPDFQSLRKGLDALSKTMAYKQGGMIGLEKAKRARTVTTTVLDSGLQISGKLVGIVTKNLNNENATPVYLKYDGPVQLAYQDQEIKEQGPHYHSAGYSTPLGRVRNLGNRLLSQVQEKDLDGLSRFEFESGIVLTGELVRKIKNPNQSAFLILTFKNCTVKDGDQILFHPDWGVFDLACGEKVVSVFGEAADRAKYAEVVPMVPPKKAIPKTNLTAKNQEMNLSYKKLRDIRERGQVSAQALRELADELKKYPDDWLLRLEWIELCDANHLKLECAEVLMQDLCKISATSEDKRHLISRGLALLNRSIK